jgi:CheY-like chemotaxis protein
MAEKILIVDDDVDTLRLVGLMLERQGYEIRTASNGAQALVSAKAEHPDLIVLDIMMPDMDGFEVTRRSPERPASRSPCSLPRGSSRIRWPVTMPVWMNT